MNNRIIIAVFSLLLLASCASIPKETILLSKMIGTDLQTLHSSHRNTVQLYYNSISTNIETFINDVYAPFIINNVLESELAKQKAGEVSMYSIIGNVGKINSENETEEALNIMLEFQEAAYSQISFKREELLSPILKQEIEILNSIDQSYQNTINANASITAYLTSLYKLKESQNEALSFIGLKGLDVAVTDRLVKLSELVDMTVKKGEQIDIKSDSANQQINDIVNKIKGLTNKMDKNE